MGALGDLGCRGGSLVIPKEFEKSNLVLELKAGKKRLELVLQGLTNEQCRKAGAVQSDSITELISHLIKNEFRALNEACERLAVPRSNPAASSAELGLCREESRPTPTVPSKACWPSSRSCGPPSSALLNRAREITPTTALLQKSA